MTTTTRTAALGALAALMLAIGSPRYVAAHNTLTEEEAAGSARAHFPEAPTNLRVESVPGLSHSAIVVSWSGGHSHGRCSSYYPSSTCTYSSNNKQSTNQGYLLSVTHSGSRAGSQITALTAIGRCYQAPSYSRERWAGCWRGRPTSAARSQRFSGSPFHVRSSTK